MKVLMITWEFPPFLAGGLGMACYGMAKALLEKGVEIDLILPTAEDIYFPLRNPEDADLLPARYLTGEEVKIKGSLEERLIQLGLSVAPETYLSPEERILKQWEIIIKKGKRELVEISRELMGGEDLFKKVAELAGRMNSVAENLHFDIIHAHDWLTYPAALVVKHITGKPLIAHIHATEFDRAGGPGDGRIHRIEYLGLREADIVVAVSAYTAKMVIDRYLVPPSKVRVVHNAHSVKTMEPKERIFRDPVVLFLGRITIQKGPDYFIEVADRVLRKFPHVHFIMAGTGDMLTKMIHLSADRELGTGVLFTGFLDRKGVKRILKASDIFIMPSVSEPFGIAPLEAMAYGVIPIISKNSGVAEIVENAYKVDFWDVEKMVSIIEELLRDRSQMEQLSIKVREEASKIQWDNSAEKLLEIYMEVL